MTEQEQVQVIQADRDAAAVVYKAILPPFDGSWRATSARRGNVDDLDTVQAFARHRHTATAEALEALRQIAGYSEVNGMTRIRMRKIAAAAIAKIEGEQP